MSAVVKSWIRAFCERCHERRVFVLQEGWTLECTDCGCRKTLQPNGLLAGV